MSSGDTSFRSHFDPPLALGTHVARVAEAARFLLSCHSARVRDRRPETRQVLETAVRCHDLGKGGPAFQAYIRDPPGYRGTSRAKEHSALSAAMALLWAAGRGWAPLPALALAQVVAGHHSGFATLDRLRNDRLRLDDDDLLLEQWQQLDKAAISCETGLEPPVPEGDFEDGARWLFRRKRVAKVLERVPTNEAVGFRLWTQFLLSILLEADKAFLALPEDKRDLYLETERPHIDPDLVSSFLGGLPETPLNPLRNRVRARVEARIASDHRLFTLTLPTGVGKTLLASSWALAQRSRMAEESGTPPRVVIVLPFLSIIDQTVQVYRQLLEVGPGVEAQSSVLMASHSLSYRTYELEGRRLEDRDADFFLDTWRSEVIITTFDQLLLALFSPAARHLMRFHALMDALVIIDEVQSLPCGLWDLVDRSLDALTREGNSRVLMMSATQPGMLSGALELAGDPPEVQRVFSHFKRYRIRLRHRTPMLLEDLEDELEARVEGWIEAGRRALVTLNTRASARSVWLALSRLADARVPVYLISADVTPFDRLWKIEQIRDGAPCFVVSTQTIEAGVDIDMDLTLRDFAPLDSLIQVAGRCNRNNRLGDYGGEIEVVSLVNARGRPFARMIYHPVLLDATLEVLAPLSDVGEEDVLPLSQLYFDALGTRMDTGEALTRAFALWEEMENVHRLLRGRPGEQIPFLALPADETGATIVQELHDALEVEDRWDRRSELRRLAPGIQQHTVQIYARPGLEPGDFADPVGPFWMLHPGYYTADAGLELRLEEDVPAWIF